MNGMFFGCSSLKELDLSSFNTQNVTNMKWMFYQCSSLKDLNISNFNIQNVTNLEDMFCECPSLKKEILIWYDNQINLKNKIKNQNIHKNVPNNNTLEKLIDLFDLEFSVLSILEEDEVRNKIIELNYNVYKIREWILIKLSD